MVEFPSVGWHKKSNHDGVHGHRVRLHKAGRWLVAEEYGDDGENEWACLPPIDPEAPAFFVSHSDWAG